MQHERADEGGVGNHVALRQIGADAVAFLQVVVGLPVFAEAGVVFVVDDFEIAAGAEQITCAVEEVNEITRKNKTSIENLANEVEKFKV